MAFITFSPGWEHVRGHVGGFVYKVRGSRNILAQKPEREPPRDSPAQLAQQGRFGKGADYARSLKPHPDAVAFYRAIADQRQSNWWAVAVQDRMHPPIVKAIELSGYHQRPGDLIWINAVDEVAVKAVSVAIQDSAGALLENGPAAFDAASGLWKYTATVDASGKTGLTITATATDRPGNTGTLTATQ